jgi:hypothetical protein
MKYQHKLDASVTIGAFLAPVGIFIDNPITLATGIGLMVSGLLGLDNNYDEFSELREESERRGIGKLGKARPSLREVVLECVGDRIIDCPTITNQIVTDTDLFRQAERQGYDLTFQTYKKLADTANKIIIDNTVGNFEQTVLDPIKKVQGIYY